MAQSQRKSRPIPAHVLAMIDALPESGNITVACKLPNGLILKLFEMRDTEELVMGGGVRTVSKAFQMDRTPVELTGSRSASQSILHIGGYALTPNVDAQFFAEYLRQNYDSDIVQNRLIFAHESRDHIEGQAKDAAEVKSGLEPLNPDGDSRAPQRVKTAKLNEEAAAA